MTFTARLVTKFIKKLYKQKINCYTDTIRDLDTDSQKISVLKKFSVKVIDTESKRFFGGKKDDLGISAELFSSAFSSAQMLGKRYPQNKIDSLLFWYFFSADL